MSATFEQNTRLNKVEILNWKTLMVPRDWPAKWRSLYRHSRGLDYSSQRSTGDHDKWVNTEGSPLGLAFDANNNLLIADAYKGLLQVSPRAKSAY